MEKEIKFKQNASDTKFSTAYIFEDIPHVTFIDGDGKMITGTSYEFNTPENLGKLKQLREYAIEFIKDHGWILPE